MTQEFTDSASLYEVEDGPWALLERSRMQVSITAGPCKHTHPSGCPCTYWLGSEQGLGPCRWPS